MCGRRFGKGFVVHHIRYAGEGDHYTAFPRDSAEYAEHILAAVRDRRCDFALLCARHHRMVEMLKGMGPDKFEAMVQIVIASRRPADLIAVERQTPGWQRQYLLDD